MHYFYVWLGDWHFLTPGQSEVTPGQMPGCSYATAVDTTKLFQEALMLLKERGAYNFKCCM